MAELSREVNDSCRVWRNQDLMQMSESARVDQMLQATISVLTFFLGISHGLR